MTFLQHTACPTVYSSDVLDVAILGFEKKPTRFNHLILVCFELFSVGVSWSEYQSENTL